MADDKGDHSGDGDKDRPHVPDPKGDDAPDQHAADNGVADESEVLIVTGKPSHSEGKQFQVEDVEEGPEEKIRSKRFRRNVSKGFSRTGSRFSRGKGSVMLGSAKLPEGEEGQEPQPVTAAEVQAAPGNVTPFLGDTGSVLGSSILLASQKYLKYFEAKVLKPLHKEKKEKPMKTIKEDEEDEVFTKKEYVETVTGRMPLAEAARMIAEDATQKAALFGETQINMARADCQRRVLVIGIAFFLLFSSHYSVRNAASSLGSDRQLSIMCYGAIYSLMWFGGVCANPLICRIKPKYAMVAASIGFIIHPLSYYYRQYYTIIPTSILAGFSNGMIWSTEGVYLMNIASSFALVSGQTLVETIGKFNGTIFTFFLSSNILGNLISSLILGSFYTLPGEKEFFDDFNARQQAMLGNTSSLNSSDSATGPVCGLEFYDKNDPTKAPPAIFMGKQHIFFGVNTGLALIGSLTIFFFLKPLEIPRTAGNKSLLRMLRLLFETFADRRSCLLIPLFLYFGFIASTILADFSSGFVACGYGPDKIGFVIMTAFVFSAVGAFLSDTIVHKLGRLPVFLTSLLVGMSSVICMLVWVPERGTLQVMGFVPTCLWALSDGILFTQTNGLLSMVYTRRVVQSLTMMSMCLAIGAMFGTFAVSGGLFSLTVKVYLVIGLNVVAGACYVTLELLLNKGILTIGA